MPGRKPGRPRRPQTEAQKRATMENLAKGRERRKAINDGQSPDPSTFPNPLDAHAPARENTRSRIPAAVRKDCKTVLAFGVAGADKAAGLASKLWADRAEERSGFWPQEDQLSKDETTHLVNAVYAELSDYPKLVEAIARMARGQKHLYLSYVVTMIAMPRLIRHGIVKEDDPLVSAVLFAQLAVADQLAQLGSDDDEPAVSVAPGSTPVDHWRNGNGQVDVGGAPVDLPFVVGGAAEQAG